MTTSPRTGRLRTVDILDDPSTSQLYQKILQPSLSAVSVQAHPNRHGVQIHNSFVPQQVSSSSYINHIKNPKLKSEFRTTQSRSFPDIKNSRKGFKAECSIYRYQHSEANFLHSATPQSFSSTTKVKQVPLPSVQGTVLERVMSQRNARSVTLAGERYLGTAKLRPQQRSLSAGRLPRSEQEKRYVKEQMALETTRSMKRMSETMSHRIDRMYYMRGATIKPAQRYYVDSEELEQLKQMSKARSVGRSGRSRNGRRYHGNHLTTTPPPPAQSNTGGKKCDNQCVSEDDGDQLRVQEVVASLSNRPGSAASNKSSGSRRGQPSPGVLLPEGQSVLGTFSETSRNINQQHVEEEDARRKKPVDFEDEESIEPWGELEEKVGENVGSANSRKTISDALPINIIEKNYKSSREEIFLTQFEDPSMKKNLLDNKENLAQDDRHSHSSSNSSIQGDKKQDRESESKKLKNSKEKLTDPKADMVSSGQHIVTRDNSCSGSIEAANDNSLSSSVKIASDNSCSGSIKAASDDESETDIQDRISLKDEGYEMNTNDEEIKNMEDGIRKFDTISNQMGNIGHLEDSEVGMKDEEIEEIYDSGVFSRPRNEEEMQEALARKENRRKEKAAKKKQEDEERRRKAMPKEEKAAILADVYTFISPRQQTIFEEKFQELDVNDNGILTLDELQERMKKWVGKEDIKLIMQIFDLNKDKTIDVREFVTMAALNDKITGHVTESPDQQLAFSLKKLSHHVTAYKEMFDIMDVNGNSQLSMEELMVIIVASTGLDLQADQDVVKYIYDTIDKDKSGSIDFVEYLSYIPFFLKLYQHVFGKPISLDVIEDALQSVRQHKW
ncbi:uncharacterized protein LOC117107551 [Anneissia japonica]|uniref:uncharacterized protein LOC117107551 n=1 Tax=Anneissia japonica TaxID=1529436 RepID=UPI00142594BB|nr:uncharacterized protein LOC117107551 [Anneissia japonica]